MSTTNEHDDQAQDLTTQERVGGRGRKTMRANRIAITTTDNGYKADFYKTHKHIATLTSADTTWVASEDATPTKAREEFRDFAIQHAEDVDVDWLPSLQKQAWERKHKVYVTNEQIAEDMETLLGGTIDRLLEKSKHGGELIDIVLTDVRTGKVPQSMESYTTDGRYNKHNGWACADLEVTITYHIDQPNLVTDVEILYPMSIVSGQIKKPKLTIADWNSMVDRELDLMGIVVEEIKEAKEA